jgi:tetratricopeptide (TPR) repeat protein
MKSLNTTEIAQLEALWTDTLPDDQKSDVENRLKKDTEFRVAAEQLRLTLRYMDYKYREDLRKHLVNLPPPPVLTSTIWYKKQWIRAAIFIGVLITGLVFVLNRSVVTQAQAQLDPIVQKHLIAPIWTRSISGPVKIEEQISEAAKAYNQQDYAKAARLFGSAFESKPNDKDIAFFAGVSYLCNGKPDLAIRYLSPLLPDTGDGRLSWYLALAYLQQGNKPETNRLLEQLKSKNVTFSQRAEALLNELNIRQ